MHASVSRSSAVKSGGSSRKSLDVDVARRKQLRIGPGSTNIKKRLLRMFRVPDLLRIDDTTGAVPFVIEEVPVERRYEATHAPV